MKDYKNILLKCAEDTALNAKDFLSQEKINDMTKMVKQKINDFSPGIMVYGVYNAGKSTLLNALIGQEYAEMSDRPETCKVARFEWHGYNVYDTPGIDAPQEHEKITEQHLKQIEVVIFVISTDGVVEEANVYDRICCIAKQKSVILVLNNKSAYDPLELKEIKDKVLSNLAAVDSAIKDIPLLVVNAASALKGRIEKKQTLLEQSGILRLEKEMDSIMRQTSIIDSVCTTSGLIMETAKETIAIIDAKIKSHDNGQLIAFANRIRSIQRVFNNECHQITEDECQNLIQTIRKNADLPNADSNTINDILSKANIALSKKLSDKLEAFIDKLNQELSREILVDSTRISNNGNFKVKIENNADTGNIAASTVDALRKIDFNTLTTIGSALKSISTFAKWGEWLAKNAGKIAIPLQIALSIVETFIGYRKDSNAVEMQKKQMMQFHQAIDDLKYEMMKKYQEFLDKWFKEIDIQITDALNGLNEKNNNSLTALQKNRSGLVEVCEICKSLTTSTQ